MTSLSTRIRPLLLVQSNFARLQTFGAIRLSLAGLNPPVETLAAMRRGCSIGKFSEVDPPILRATSVVFVCQHSTLAEC